MQSILNSTAITNNVAPGFLEFIGVQDERSTVGKVLYHFTIMDPDHLRYESTVAFVKDTGSRPELTDRCVTGQDKATEVRFSGM